MVWTSGSSSLLVVLGIGVRPVSWTVWVEWFLTHFGSDGSLESPKSVWIEVVDALRVASCRRLGREAMALHCSAIRSLPRFSLLRGLVAQHVSSLVVTPRFYPLERVPYALDWYAVRDGPHASHLYLDAVDDWSGGEPSARSAVLGVITARRPLPTGVKTAPVTGLERNLQATFGSPHATSVQPVTV